MNIISVNDIFTKAPSENYTVSVSFAGALASGDTLSSCVVSSEDMTFNVNYSTGAIAVIGSTTATIDSPSALVVVQGGMSGRNYKINFTATSAAGDTLEKELLMRVR